MFKLIFMFMMALIASCGDSKSVFTQYIPSAFVVEESLYTHSGFPDCRAMVASINSKLVSAFVQKKESFIASNEYLYSPWQASPLPEKTLEGVDIDTRTVDAGMVCLDQGQISPKAEKYNKLYNVLLRQSGSFYSFSEDSESFLLFNPEQGLLFHVMHH